MAEAGGARPLPPYFGRSVNPIWTSGARYAPHISARPLRFSDLAPSLEGVKSYERTIIKIQMPKRAEWHKYGPILPLQWYRSKLKKHKPRATRNQFSAYHFIASEYHFAKEILDAPYQKRLNDGECINSLLCGMGHFTSFMFTGGYINLQYGVFKKYIIIPILPTGIN